MRVIFAFLAIFDLKFSQNQDRYRSAVFCSVFVYFEAIIVPNFVRIWSVVGLEISKNYEKCMFLQVKISHFQGKIRPWRRETGQNLMKHGWKRIFRWFRISNQIFHSIYRSRVIRRSLNPILALFEENRNFKDEYLGGKFFFRHETWHDGSEPSFLPSDQKLAKSIA